MRKYKNRDKLIKQIVSTVEDYYKRTGLAMRPTDVAKAMKHSLNDSKERVRFYASIDRATKEGHLKKFPLSDESRGISLAPATINDRTKFVKIALDTVKIGNNIRTFRKLRDLTQKELASMLNLSQWTIKDYECGQRSAMHRIKAIAKALQIDPDLLVGKKTLDEIPTLFGETKKPKKKEVKEEKIDTENTVSNKIGRNISRLRQDAGLTQQELAEKVGVTWEMISRYERGESSPMSKIEKITEALNVSSNELLGVKTGLITYEQAYKILSSFFSKVENLDSKDRKALLESVESLVK